MLGPRVLRTEQRAHRHYRATGAFWRQDEEAVTENIDQARHRDGPIAHQHQERHQFRYAGSSVVVMNFIIIWRWPTFI